MNYTIEDLRGKYVEVGTPECEVFLDACESLGLGMAHGATPRHGLFAHVNDAGELYQDRKSWISEKNYTPFTPKPAWTIYNNDEPLSELSDEQRGLLVNYLFSSGDTETFNGEVWLDMLSGFNLINREFIYRAKQKSEKELFIDVALDSYDADHPELTPEQMSFAAAMMFDAGFKAPKGGE